MQHKSLLGSMFIALYISTSKTQVTLWHLLCQTYIMSAWIWEAKNIFWAFAKVANGTLRSSKKTEHLVEDWCVLDHQRGKSEMKGYYMERRESAKWLLGKRYTKKQYEAAAQHLRKKNSIHSHTLLHKNGTHTSILSCSWLMHISTHT